MKRLLYDGKNKEYSIDQGPGGDREGKPVRPLKVSQVSKEEIARKIKNFKGKKMSNGNKPTSVDGKRNTRKRLEEALEGNLNLAQGVLSLTYQISICLFGAKPEVESAKESAETESSLFNRAGDVADKTRIYLNEAGEKLRVIIKELK